MIYQLINYKNQCKFHSRSSSPISKVSLLRSSTLHQAIWPGGTNFRTPVISIYLAHSYSAEPLRPCILFDLAVFPINMKLGNCATPQTRNPENGCWTKGAWWPSQFLPTLIHIQPAIFLVAFLIALFILEIYHGLFHVIDNAVVVARPGMK
jgi:hypothetical protein